MKNDLTLPEIFSRIEKINKCNKEAKNIFSRAEAIFIIMAGIGAFMTIPAVAFDAKGVLYHVGEVGVYVLIVFVMLFLLANLFESTKSIFYARKKFIQDVDIYSTNIQDVVNWLCQHSGARRKMLRSVLQIRLRAVDRRLEFVGGKMGSLGVIPTLTSVIFMFKNGADIENIPRWSSFLTAAIMILYSSHVIASLIRISLNRMDEVLELAEQVEMDRRAKRGVNN